MKSSTLGDELDELFKLFTFLNSRHTISQFFLKVWPALVLRNCLSGCSFYTRPRHRLFTSSPNKAVSPGFTFQHHLHFQLSVAHVPTSSQCAVTIELKKNKYLLWNGEKSHFQHLISYLYSSGKNSETSEKSVISLILLFTGMCLSKTHNNNTYFCFIL